MYSVGFKIASYLTATNIIKSIYYNNSLIQILAMSNYNKVLVRIAIN